MSRIDRTADHDQISVGDDLRLEYRGEPFTGEVVETIGDQLLSQVFYVDGVQHGADREWWADGPLKSEGEVRHGRAVGTFREWHHNGQLAREKQFNERGRLVSVTTWDDEGNPIPR
ncbi:toxin-antitoxin system YwqK family antitoxin [Nocardia sp. NPDC003693]